MRRLLLDVGNSALKWAFADGERLGEGGGVLWRDVDLPALLEHEFGTVAAPDEVWLSSVAEAAIESALQAWCGQHWPGGLHRARTERRRAGLVNAYRMPAQMGVDRWLAMLAVWVRRREAFCVVQCGTAITFDVVDDDGRHLGGQIAAGLGTTRRMLSGGTARVGELEELEELEGAADGAFGAATEACVTAGTLGQTVGMIERALAQAARTLGRLPHCVIAGGDAPAIRPHLDTPFEYDPRIVLEGLRVYADTRS